MFHALGFMQAIFGVALGSTLVVRRRFDPETTLESLERHRASTLVVVPVMLRRILDLGKEAIQDRDLIEFSYSAAHVQLRRQLGL